MPVSIPKRHLPSVSQQESLPPFHPRILCRHDFFQIGFLVVADIRFGLIEMMQQFIDMASDLGIFCCYRERQAPIEIPRLPDILIMAANSLFSNRLRDNNSSLTRTVKLIFSPARSASTLRPLFRHHERLRH